MPLIKRMVFDHRTTGATAETVFDKDRTDSRNPRNQPLRWLSIFVAENSCWLNFDGTEASMVPTDNNMYFESGSGIGRKWQSPESAQVDETIPKISIMRSGSNNARVTGVGYLWGE